LTGFSVQPPARQKIAEIEVGRLDEKNGQLTLLFYPVDAAGQRRRDYHVPLFTSGKRFELAVEVIDWRGTWAFLGERGFYQYVSLSGDGAENVRKDLSVGQRPGGVGGAIFLQQSTTWQGRPAKDLREGEVYDVFLGESLEVTLRK
jgi:hypothetical protein